MKICIAIPPGVTVTAVSDSAGNVTALEIVPEFLTEKGLENVATVSSTSDGGNVLHRALLQVSGKTGMVNLRTRRTVVAQADADAADEQPTK